MDEQEWDEKAVGGELSFRDGARVHAYARSRSYRIDPLFLFVRSFGWLPRHTDRIPLPAIKTLIQQLATRTNYGLDASSDLPDTATADVNVPAGLQLWFWEVEDEEKWVSEFAARLEKRKKERQEVSRLSLFFWSYLRHEYRAPLSRLAAFLPPRRIAYSMGSSHKEARKS